MQLTQALHRAAAITPHAPMTIFGDRQRTCAETVARIARLAGALRASGVEEGDRVAMLALNSDRYVECLYATWWAGAVVNPVNIRWSPAEIAFSLRDSATTTLIVDDTFAPMLGALGEAGHPVRTLIHAGDGPAPQGALDLERLVASTPPIEDARRAGEDLAGILYTGGTTGSPKGVMLSHRALWSSAVGTLSSGDFLAPGGRLLHAAPMFHLAALASCLAQTVVGGTHVIVAAFDPAAVLRTIDEQRITHSLLVPTMIQMLLDHPGFADHDLSSLERIVYGGSPITLGVLDRAQELLPAVAFTQAYGMTELAPVASLLGAADHAAKRKLASGGRPAPHVEVRIAGPDGAPLAPGEVGEILVRGPNLMTGYWERPDETRAALRDGWMHTGDGGYLDHDGYLFVVDRIKDMIVTGGENVYSAEVETALSLHPAVAACAIIGLPDDVWGERVHAVVVLGTGATTTSEELRAHVRGRIAGYKVPRTIDFADTLPLSAAGKVLKRELRETYAARV